MPLLADAKQLGEHLHQQLLSGASLAATSQIAELFLPPLLKRLRRMFRNIQDQDLVDEAVEDAFQNYFAHPQQFDPARANLATYLQLRAKTYLLNSLAQQKSHQERFVVEVDASEPVYTIGTPGESSVEDLLIEHETQAAIVERLLGIVTDPVDFKFVMLMIEGVRETGAYAEILCVASLPLEEQVQIVKRNKDRLKKLVQRKYKLKRL